MGLGIIESLGGVPETVAAKVVMSDDDFHRESESRSVSIKLGDGMDEIAYENDDRNLAGVVDKILLEQLDDKNKDVLFHQIYDWWPNCTRFIEIDSACLSWDLLKSLQSVLVGLYSNWAINIQVYDGIDMPDAPHLGAINVYAKEFLLTSRKEHRG